MPAVGKKAAKCNQIGGGELPKLPKHRRLMPTWPAGIPGAWAVEDRGLQTGRTGAFRARFLPHSTTMGLRIAHELRSVGPIFTFALSTAHAPGGDESIAVPGKVFPAGKGGGGRPGRKYFLVREGAEGWRKTALNKIKKRRKNTLVEDHDG